MCEIMLIHPPTRPMFPHDPGLHGPRSARPTSKHGVMPHATHHLKHGPPVWSMDEDKVSVPRGAHKHPVWFVCHQNPDTRSTM